jgi:hypothetical protein
MRTFLFAFIGVLQSVHGRIAVRARLARPPTPTGTVLRYRYRSFDLGGRGDKSFPSTVRIETPRAVKELGARVRFCPRIWGEGSDSREAGLRGLLAAEGMKLVIGVGFILYLTTPAGEPPKNIRNANLPALIMCSVDRKRDGKFQSIRPANPAAWGLRRRNHDHFSSGRWSFVGDPKN